jgi:hypothetical protein
MIASTSSAGADRRDGCGTLSYRSSTDTNSGRVSSW